MLQNLVVYWNIFFLIFCVLLNLDALIVHLGKWRGRYKNRTSASGGEVASPAAVAVFFVLCANLVGTNFAHSI